VALSTLRTRLDDQKQRVTRQDQRLKALEARVKELGRATALDLREGERRDAHVGSLEVRLADLEQGLADLRSGVAATAPDDDQLAAGRTLLDDVRTEHARIRARMQVVSAYEERLRRVEESVTELFDGDRRHLV
jgi:exonuclease VII small subunit